jgi:hypothetical protein
LKGTVTVRGQERAHPPIPSTPRRQITDPCNKAASRGTCRWGYQAVRVNCLAFMTKEWRGFVLSLFCGVLYLVGGLLIMNEPVQGARVLTLLAAAALIVSGVVRIVLALQHRAMPAGALVLLSGIVSIVVGCLLYSSLPWSGLWVLGTPIAVELVVQGASWALLWSRAAYCSAGVSANLGPRTLPRTGFCDF